jgi:uroporphyrinogen-III synthase
MPTSTRIVLTREKGRNQSWAKRLVAAGVPVIELPLLRFEVLSVPEAMQTTRFDWILFTSPQGVKAFVAAGLSPGDIGTGKRPGPKFAALGGGTSTALADAGLPDGLDIRSRDGTTFAKAFAKRISPPANVLLPGPETCLPEPRRSLEEAGFTVTEVPLYRTVPVPPTELPPVDFAPGDTLFFCSPSAVRAFTEAWHDRPPCVGIGETTARVARDAGFPTVVARASDLEAMVLAAGLDPISPAVAPKRA